MGYYDTEYKIIGTRRDTGKPEIVYHGYDYSNVSDMMLNPDEGSKEYSHMTLYEDGQVTESHSQPLPRPGDDLGSWIILALIVVVVLCFIYMH